MRGSYRRGSTAFHDGRSASATATATAQQATGAGRVSCLVTTITGSVRHRTGTRASSVGAACHSAAMETLSNQQVLDAELSDWRKLAQGLWTRYQIADYAAGARFVTAVAQAAEAAPITTRTSS